MSIFRKKPSSRTGDLLSQILWQSRPRWQLLGAAIGTGLGFFLLLGALQVYFDLHELLGGSASDQYVQINKRVSFVNTLGGSAVFTQEEIAELEEQPFIESLASFRSNEFKVGAGSSTLGFYTELFFESLPRDFIDVETNSFQWEEGDSEVPIILSRDYLALYNFGFAPSQGLPQFTPNTIKRVSMELFLRGSGKRATMSGRIVGFSDRINSILVPDSFLQWANDKYGTGGGTATSRLILKVENPMAKEFRDFLKERNYELSTGRLVGGEAVAAVQLVVGILALIGLLIAGLSMLVVSLNYRLLISEASSSIQRLYELGYKQKDLAAILNSSSTKWYGLSWLVAIAALVVLHMIGARLLSGQGLEISGWLHSVVWVAAVLLAIVFFYFQRRNINRNLERLFA